MPIPLQLTRYRVRHGGGDHHRALGAIADTAVVFPPVHFGGIGAEIRAANVMVLAVFSPPKARKV